MNDALYFAAFLRRPLLRGRKNATLLLAATILGAALPAGLEAQTGTTIQAVPSAAAVERLNQNLGRLSRSPQDVQALLGAGQAALDLGDVQAANGFFTRANMVAPNNGQVKLGLAVVSIALKQASDAATYFDEAAALGVGAQGHLADRALAYDLTGQQAKAQQDYLTALRANPGDSQTRLRYAISLGISGRIAEADQQLEPALTAQDREAWRAKAFILAMNGRLADARKITQSVMPKGLADALDPYIARAALLNPAQKAAAVHYGEFPSGVLQMAANTPPPVERTDPVAVTKPKKGRLSRREREAQEAAERAEAAKAKALAAAEPAPPSYQEPATRPASNAPQQVALNSVPPRQGSNPPGPASPRPTTPEVANNQPVVRPGIRPGIVRTTPATTPVASGSSSGASAPAASALVQGPPASTGTGSAPNPAPQSSAPAFAAATTASPPATNPPAPVPTASAEPATPPAAEPETRSLADVMAGIRVAENERQPSAAPVDLAAVARIQADRRKAQEAVAAKAAAEKAKRDAAAKAKAEAAAKAKAEAEEKARLAANPARLWVQVATGKDVGALAFDLRRMRRTYADALGTQAGWTAEWGATRRLLVGPYPSAAKAREAVAAIKKSGGDAFIWNSEAGEEVEKIGGK